MPTLTPYQPPNLASGNAGLPYLYAAAGGAQQRAQSANIDRQNTWDIAKGVANFAGGEVSKWMARQAQDQQRDDFIQHAESTNPNLADDQHWQMGKAMMMGGVAPKDAMSYVEKARAGDTKATAVGQTGAHLTRADETAATRAGTDATFKGTMGGVAIQNADTRQQNAENRLDLGNASIFETKRGHDLSHEDRQAREKGLEARYPAGSNGQKPTVAQRYATNATPGELASSITSAGGDVSKIGLARSELRRRGLDDSGQPNTPETTWDAYQQAKAAYDAMPESTGYHLPWNHPIADAKAKLDLAYQRYLQVRSQAPASAAPVQAAPAANEPTDADILRIKAANPDATPEDIAAILRGQ